MLLEVAQCVFHMLRKSTNPYDLSQFMNSQTLQWLIYHKLCMNPNCLRLCLICINPINDYRKQRAWAFAGFLQLVSKSGVIQGSTLCYEKKKCDILHMSQLAPWCMLKQIQINLLHDPSCLLKPKCFTNRIYAFKVKKEILIFVYGLKSDLNWKHVGYFIESKELL